MCEFKDVKHLTKSVSRTNSKMLWDNSLVTPTQSRQRRNHRTQGDVPLVTSVISDVRFCERFRIVVSLSVIGYYFCIQSFVCPLLASENLFAGSYLRAGSTYGGLCWLLLSLLMFLSG